MAAMIARLPRKPSSRAEDAAHNVLTTHDQAILQEVAMAHDAIIFHDRGPV
jgi:hypothetical protein